MVAAQRMIRNYPALWHDKVKVTVGETRRSQTPNWPRVRAGSSAQALQSVSRRREIRIKGQRLAVEGHHLGIRGAHDLQLTRVIKLHHRMVRQQSRCFPVVLERLALPPGYRFQFMSKTLI